MNYRDEAWLREKYWDEGLSKFQIASLAGACSTTILKWMKRHSIPRRSGRGPGWKHTPEARQKISEASKGRKLSAETKQKLSEANKGKKHTPEYKEHMSRTMKIKARRGKNHPAWKGGRTGRGGYVLIRSPGHPRASKSHYVLEHVLIAERVLGRPLQDEHIHHINGKRDDNRLENLQIMKPYHKQPICPHCGWPMGNLQEYVEARQGK